MALCASRKRVSDASPLAKEECSLKCERCQRRIVGAPLENTNYMPAGTRYGQRTYDRLDCLYSDLCDDHGSEDFLVLALCEMIASKGAHVVYVRRVGANH